MRMSGGGGSQNSLRKTLGALKDTTTVSLAKINSDYKKLDIAIVKATNHYERPAKERHISAIFVAISASRPRADVAYCIHALARRLSKTRNWLVALKTLIVIHRAVREVGLSFQEQLLNYGRSRNHILNLTNFKDDSSPDARGYSSWVRSYALYLEERLECFRILKYDIEADHLRTKDLDTPGLLEHLPALQQLLYRVIGCQPQGTSIHNFIIQLALAMVASESIKIYTAISNGSANLVDKFFEMERNDALKALDTYQRAGSQAERLSEFYEVCKNLDVEREKRYIKIELPPASLLQAMEEYVMDASRTSTDFKDQGDDKPKAVLAIVYKNSTEVKAECPPSPTKPEPEPEYKSVKVETPVLESQPDLLDLNDPVPAALELDEKNALALAIIPDGVEELPVSAGPNLMNGSSTGWELALVMAASSNESTAAASKLAGGFDKLTLESLYDDAIRRSNQNVSYNPWEQTAPTANSTMPEFAHDPFYASNTVAAPPSVQMAHMTNQQQTFMLQQHQQMMMMGPQPMNPFGNPYGPVGHSYGQAYNPFS